MFVYDIMFLMKRADYTLGAVMLMLGFLITFIYGKMSGKETASKVFVYVDTKCVSVLDLSQDFEYAVSNEYGNNTVEIKSGKVYIKDSDCKGNDCVKMSGISKSGESICCLPHRLYIVIEGDSEGTVDTVAY